VQQCNSLFAAAFFGVGKDLGKSHSGKGGFRRPPAELNAYLPLGPGQSGLNVLERPRTLSAIERDVLLDQ
jgi:hypothetical protein